MTHGRPCGTVYKGSFILTTSPGSPRSGTSLPSKSTLTPPALPMTRDKLLEAFHPTLSPRLKSTSLCFPSSMVILIHEVSLAVTVRTCSPGSAAGMGAGGGGGAGGAGGAKRGGGGQGAKRAGF